MFPVHLIHPVEQALVKGDSNPAAENKKGIWPRFGSIFVATRCKDNLKVKHGKTTLTIEYYRCPLCSLPLDVF
jgi:hypothetical protein